MKKHFTIIPIFILFLGSIYAQTITLLPTNGQAKQVKQCDGFVFDDGGEIASYNDDIGARTDIATICPTTASSSVIRIEFTQFDVAPGDQLLAYDGTTTTAPLFSAIGPSGTGVGASVSDAPGGGNIQASCFNQSGCITLALTVNGDRIRGAGFRGRVTCSPRVGTVLDCSRIDAFNGSTGKYFAVAPCSDNKQRVQIPIPRFTDCGTIGKLTVSSSCSVNLPSSADGTGTGFIEGTFPIGTHTITFAASKYPDLKCQAVVQVLAPNLSCNDDVNVSLSNDCVVIITPNIILKNECSTAFVTRPVDGAQIPVVNYTVELANSAQYEILGYTVENYPIVDFSKAPCGAKFDVRIIKTLLNDSNCNGKLFNGTAIDDVPMVNLCWGRITIEDKTPPIIAKAPKDLAIPCYEKSYDPTGTLAKLNILDPNLRGNGGTIYLPLANANLFLQGAEQLEVLENCSWGVAASKWEFVEETCGQKRTLTDWNGVVFQAATFGYYKRTFTVSDKCTNKAIHEQRVYVYQPAISAPLPEFKLACNVSAEPKDLRKSWIDWVRAGRPANDPRKEYAAFLPNFDPTPIDFPQYYITNNSGDEVPMDVSHVECGYAVDWLDSNKIPVCGESFKIFRTWTVYDWCDGQFVLIGILPQVIQVGDTQAPTILTPLSYQVSGGASQGCKVNVTFNRPEVVDDCKGEVTLSIKIGTLEKTFQGSTVILENIPADEEVTIELIAKDACGNTKRQTKKEIFVDSVPPTVICEAKRVVAVGLTCEAIVQASSFDDGSFDNCGQITFAIARMEEGTTIPTNDKFAPTITFNKNDLGQSCNNNVRVVLRATDGKGNVNYCMTQVELQDKLSPTANNIAETITCTDPAFVELIALKKNLNIVERVEGLAQLLMRSENIGKLNAIDNCAPNNSLIIRIIDADFNRLREGCGGGEVSYRYRLIDPCGNSSLIYAGAIEVKSASDWIMTFPTDKELFCTSSEALAIAPANIGDILINKGCDNWGLNVKQDIFNQEADACFKIVNTYNFINWCTWNPSNTEIAVVERPDSLISRNFKVSLRYLDANGDGINDIDDGDENANGIYIYDREGPFKIRDVAEAVEFDIYDVTSLTFDADFVVIDNNNRPSRISTYQAISQFSKQTETYVSAQAYGNILYRQIIKVKDNTAPEIMVDAYATFCGGEEQPANAGACTAPVHITFTVADGCTAWENIHIAYKLKPFGSAATTDLFGNLISLGNGKFQIAGNYPLNSNGLLAKHTLVVEVEDGCGNSKILDIPFEVKDCKAPLVVCKSGLSSAMSAQGELTFPASHFDAGTLDFCTSRNDLIFTFADPLQFPDSTHRTFRCEQGEVGFVPVTIWTIDAAKNVSFCETVINISPFRADACAAQGSTIAGMIFTEMDKRVQNVEVNLGGTNNDMRMTNADGEFAFPSVELGYDYTLQPEKNNDPLNGISTFDLLLMSKHILGTSPLDSPYKIIAADVNNSKTITTLDIILLRRLLLDFDQEFSNNTSWRFVPASYEFPNPQNPWAEEFPEAININDLAADTQGVNFIAIKVGDVNYTAIANTADLEGRNSLSALNLIFEVQVLAKNKIRVPLYFEQDQVIAGFQMTLAYPIEKMRFIHLESDWLTSEHWKAENGMLRMIWWNTTAQYLKGGTPFAYAYFELDNHDVELQRELTLASLLPAEIYLQDEVHMLRLKQKASPMQQQPMIGQNTPNPFTAQTQIPILVQQEGLVHVSIRSVTGKTILHTSVVYPAGAHQMIIERNELPSAGIYFYTISMGTYSETKKMILIEE